MTRFLVLASSAFACSSTHADTTCSCFPGSFAIHAPATVVQDVTLTGEACAGTQPTCLEGSDTMLGCTKILVSGVKVGSCSVGVTFVDGRSFSVSSRLVAASGCCGGFVPEDGKDALTVP